MTFFKVCGSLSKDGLKKACTSEDVPTKEETPKRKIPFLKKNFFFEDVTGNECSCYEMALCLSKQQHGRQAQSGCSLTKSSTSLSS